MASVFKRGGKKNRGGSWFITYFDSMGKRQTRSARTTDYATAMRIAAKIEADLALEREGVVDPRLVAVAAESKRTIESHLADYRAKLVAARRESRYVDQTERTIRKVAKAAGWKTAGDIEADGLTRYCNELATAGRSARSQQAVIVCLKGFTRWLVAGGKLSRDVLASVKSPSPKSNRKRERRMLTVEEWAWLRSATINGPERFGMGAEARVALYATALASGLRSGELRSLTKARLFLDGPRPFVVVKADSTKNGKLAKQYLPADVAALLRDYAAKKLPTAELFSMPKATMVAPMLREDLEAARRLWVDSATDLAEKIRRREDRNFLRPVNEAGEHLDFHSLRHSTASWLIQAGASLKEIQTVMRHASVALTGDTYGHLIEGAAADAVSRLPSMMGDEPQTARATGTDDRVAALSLTGGLQQKLQHLRGVTMPAHATACDDSDSMVLNIGGRKPLENAELGDGLRSCATENVALEGVAKCGENSISNQYLFIGFAFLSQQHLLNR
jgi:integrase